MSFAGRLLDSNESQLINNLRFNHEQVRHREGAIYQRFLNFLHPLSACAIRKEAGGFLMSLQTNP